MEKTYAHFLKNILIYSFILAILEYLLSTQIDGKWVSNSWPFIIVFFVSFTILMHRYLLKATQDQPKKFVFAFMMFTTVKILLYLAVILIYVFINRADAVAFIMAFFLNYFLFTAFELTAVLKLFRKNK